ncbi:MAG: hypothetical protein H6514_20730 [Acidimicrobiaceae bacterium]|nr:hypothetical protein [Acidimicrobiaceae bacterium]
MATSPNNTAVGASTGPAHALVGPGQGFDNWSDANDLNRGGLKYAPFGRPAGDPAPVRGGTCDAQSVRHRRPSPRSLAPTGQRRDYASSPNDNLIVRGIGADTSLGWIGYSFCKAEEERMKAIAIAERQGALRRSDRGP